MKPCHLLLALFLLPLSSVAAQPPTPMAKEYTVQLRYSILATRDQYVAEYNALVKNLEKIGFKFDPPLDELPVGHRGNPSINILTGRMTGAEAMTQAQKLLEIPWVAQLLLVPVAAADFKLPELPDALVQVQLELAHGLSPGKQLELRDQTLAILRKLGKVSFREQVGYDHRGLTGQPHTRLRGTIPVGLLDTLLKDLRRQPTGWFAPRLATDELPAPIRFVDPQRPFLGPPPPIRLALVSADKKPAEPLPPSFIPDDLNLEKIDPDLWRFPLLDAPLTLPLRVEIILAVPPGDNEDEWRGPLLRTAPNLLIEGRLGQVVYGVFGLPFVDHEKNTLRVSPVDVKPQLRALAALPRVAHIRFSTAARGPIDPTPKSTGDVQRALKQTGLLALHKKGFRGKGVRLGIADLDFRGLEKALDEGKLSKKTRLVDLTTERNSNVYADPALPGDLLGYGTQCAIAAQLAAPEAEITLIRIDPLAPYLLDLIQQYVRGEQLMSPNLVRRADEASVAGAVLKQRRAEVLAERRLVLDNFEDETENKIRFEMLGPVRWWVFNTREWHQARVAELDRDERLHRLRELRLLFLLKEVQSLKGLDLVCVPLSWPTGYPLGGRSALARQFRDPTPYPLPEAERGKKAPSPLRGGGRGWGSLPLWFFPAGNYRGQVWHGYLRDEDNDGILEFASPEEKLPSGRWTRTLNFLAWQGYDGKQVEDVPEKIFCRLALQWTEPHEPDYYFRDDEDLYATPLTNMRVRVLRQRDPTGKELSLDDFEEVAASFGRPQRLDNSPASATYEISLVWQTSQAGRYAIQIDKQVPTRWVLESGKDGSLFFDKKQNLTPTGIRPLGVPTLPATEKRWELRPILFVEGLNSPADQPGRLVLADFRTEGGMVGVPADSRHVISVVGVDWEGKPQPYSAIGPPANQELARWPRLYVYDELGLPPAFGSNVASAFSAGAAAAYMSSGATRQQVLEVFAPKKPGVLKLGE